MSEQPRNNTKSHLALAVAQGVKVSAWARANGVPSRTAFRWAHEPEVRARVETCRRRMIDEAIGRMAKRTTWAVDGIAALAERAESESVRLRAFRAIFSDMIATSNYTGIEGRIADLEVSMVGKAHNGTKTIGSRALAKPAQAANPPARTPMRPVSPGGLDGQ